MKRKVALLLAAVMTTAMLPMNVMASSTNSINKTVTVSDGDPIEGVYLKVLPKDEITSGDSIIITIDNGEFYKETDESEDEYTCEVEYTSYLGYTYDELMAELADGMTVRNVLSQNLGNNSLELPYKIEYNSKNEIQVYLFPIDGDLCDTSQIAYDSPYYNIPIVCNADGDGDVKITIDSNESAVSGGGTYTIAKSTSSSGSTTTTVADTVSFQDSGLLETITIKENVKGTFEEGKTIKVRVSGGFEIDPSSTITVSAGSNASFDSFTVTNIEDDYFTFEMPIGDTTKASAIKIDGIIVIPEDEDDNWGDVNVTVSGTGITKQTILVATRADYGFDMSVTDDVPTILSGRAYIANNDLDEDDFESATILFEETIADTWLTNRKLEFSVPEGVKIVDWEFDEYDEMSELDAYTTITNDGTTLKIDLKGATDVIDDDEESSFELNLYFSIDADYVGDIPVSVAGAGLSADVLDDVVVATAVAPITIETTSTKLNMGYQVYDCADIVISEVQDGVFLDDEEVYIAIDDSKYGSSELGFNDADVEATVDGEVEIKNFKISGGEIKFTIDSSSYTEPASVTISGVSVGTTRSVPYGSYDIKVYGPAIINNYDEDMADDADYPSGSVNEQEEIAYFDTTEAYSFADYLVIMTETTTLDGVVEVTIGEKTMLVNGESVDMDVAAYIQTSSNSTMVPLRFVTIALGVDTENVDSVDESSKVSWDANTKTATIFYAAGSGQKIIQFQAGSAYMTVDGTQVPMENGVVAEIVDGRMFVPFRALGTALGVSVSWDAETRTAIYNG